MSDLNQNAIDLQTRRAALNLTQTELARILGTTRNTVARWERGEVQPQSWNMLLLALLALDAIRTRNSGEDNLERLTNEVVALIDRLEGIEGEAGSDVTRIKASLNLLEP